MQMPSGMFKGQSRHLPENERHARRRGGSHWDGILGTQARYGYRVSGFDMR
jgi:hypothetical protein